MSIFKVMRKAEDEKDVDAMMSFYHEDFEFVRHQSGTILTKPEYKEMVIGMFAHASFDRLMARCIYENDDILVEHFVMRFPDGTRESVLVVNTLENGQVIRQETGATLMK